MRIKHEEYGEVEGVEQLKTVMGGYAWIKDGARHYYVDGWREVTEPVYENVTGDLAILADRHLVDCGAILCSLPPEVHRFVFKDLYALPDDFSNQLYDETSLTGDDVREVDKFVQQFKQPSLQVHRVKEEG